MSTPQTPSKPQKKRKRQPREPKRKNAFKTYKHLHEQVLCFIHSLDSDALARLFAVGKGDTLTVYIPDFRASAARSEIDGFCRSLEDFLSSLGGATFAVAPYADYMKDTLEKIDCSLVFEAE